LQSNKAADAVALFDVIQTVDRARLARELAKEMGRQGRRPRLLVQVNTGEEAQKGGVLPGGLDALLALCRGELGLPVEGLMAIPPRTGHGAARGAAGEARRPARPAPGQRRDERRLRDRGPVRRDAGAGGDRDLRGAPAAAGRVRRLVA
jgi:hypothetical protein